MEFVAEGCRDFYEKYSKKTKKEITALVKVVPKCGHWASGREMTGSTAVIMYVVWDPVKERYSLIVADPRDSKSGFNHTFRLNTRVVPAVRETSRISQPEIVFTGMDYWVGFVIDHKRLDVAEFVSRLKGAIRKTREKLPADEVEVDRYAKAMEKTISKIEKKEKSAAKKLKKS